MVHSLFFVDLAILVFKSVFDGGENSVLVVTKSDVAYIMITKFNVQH